MGDDAEKRAVALEEVQANLSSLKDVLAEVRELRKLAHWIENDIDLWDIRASKLRRLCYWAIGVPPVAALIDVGGHLLGWLR
jgi:hypothetical protein